MAYSVLKTAAVMIAALSATAASAVTYTFTVTSSDPDPSDGFPNYAFQIDSSPVVSSSDAISFTIDDVNTYGTRTVFGPFNYSADYTFYTEAFGGGFGDGAGHDYLSEVLFTGPTTAPTFKTGTFQLDLDFDGQADDATLVISGPAVTAVPEPATWALMFAGFGLTGYAMRRRGRRMVAA